ncbi:hypothetical protein H2248_001707 [Termitomyces sp. 'cryptogamus']|nr:hypothetical protein H2248_001707 [Termitomyces sp. 'cryptogamus']
MSMLASLQVEAGMLEFVKSTDAAQKQAYLAKMQGTQRPILPINTVAEQNLFNQLMQECDDFCSLTTSIKLSAVKIWNHYAEAEDDIYYKLEEHLTSHFKGNWKDVTNLIHSVCQALASINPLQKYLHNPE